MSDTEQLMPVPINSVFTSNRAFTTEPVWVWGVQLAPLTHAQVLDRIQSLVVQRKPSYLVTANLHYAMLTDRFPRLRDVNAGADLVIADGMPLVWASRRGQRPIPERVAGSDLLFSICERAASLGWKIYLLGAAPGVATEASRKLCERYPGLKIVGCESPPFRKWTIEETTELFARIREAEPDIIFVAFGQPKGEIWVADHFQELGVPLAIQVGASLDFAAGRVKRAPRWIQRTGLEWVYRIAQEPRRLLLRYLGDIVFLLRMVFGSAGRKKARAAKIKQKSELV